MRIRLAVGIAVTAALLAPAGIAVRAQTPAPTTKKMALPLKGMVEVGYIMTAKRVGTNLITTFELKNLSDTGSIVGLQITQYFYDKAGNPLQGTGDRQRLRKPLGPEETTTITLTSPVVIGMTSPQHKFAHQNGEVHPVPLKPVKAKK